MKRKEFVAMWVAARYQGIPIIPIIVPIREAIKVYDEMSKAYEKEVARMDRDAETRYNQRSKT